MKKVIAFDFYDKERLKPIPVEIKKVKKGTTFELNDVTYEITKVFSKSGIEGTCVELKMVRYKIANTTTTFAHKCPARKGHMQRMTPETIELMKKKYGVKSVESWVKDGRVKMGGLSLATACPDCGCTFYKDSVQLPEKIEVISLKGKKRLTKRK